MEIIAAIILIGLCLLIGLNTTSISRGVSIGGKQFSGSISVSGSQAQAVEASVTAATAGIMTAQAQSNKTLSGVTWLAGVATFTTTAAHGYVVGQVVVVSAVVPAGYNGNYVVISVPLTTTFTVAIPIDPTSYSSGPGTVVSYNTITCNTINPFLATNKIDIYSGTTTIACQRGSVVQVVVGLAVGYNGGGGSAPSNTTVVQVNIPTQLQLSFVGNNLQCYALYGDAISNFRFLESDGTTEAISETLQAAAYVKVWDTKSPTTNPFAGVTNGSVYVSHNNTTGAQLCRVGVVVL